jgi:hypothetical protein
MGIPEFKGKNKKKNRASKGIDGKKLIAQGSRLV